MMTASGVDTKLCTTPWLVQQVMEAHNLRWMIRAGELAADPTWDGILSADIAAYQAELDSRQPGAAATRAKNPAPRKRQSPR